MNKSVVMIPANNLFILDQRELQVAGSGLASLRTACTVLCTHDLGQSTTFLRLGSGLSADKCPPLYQRIIKKAAFPPVCLYLVLKITVTKIYESE